MWFPSLYSFLLAGSFQFSFRGALPAAHFVYRVITIQSKSTRPSLFIVFIFIIVMIIIKGRFGDSCAGRYQNSGNSSEDE